MKKAFDCFVMITVVLLLGCVKKEQDSVPIPDQKQQIPTTAAEAWDIYCAVRANLVAARWQLIQPLTGYIDFNGVGKNFSAEPQFALLDANAEFYPFNWNSPDFELHPDGFGYDAGTNLGWVAGDVYKTDGTSLIPESHRFMFQQKHYEVTIVQGLPVRYITAILTINPGDPSEYNVWLEFRGE